MNVLIIPEDFRNDQYILRPLFQRLAGMSLPNRRRWPDIRREVHVKETYFDALAQQRGVADEPGRGRRTLGAEGARNIAAIRRKCREDFDHLAGRV